MVESEHFAKESGTAEISVSYYGV